MNLATQTYLTKVRDLLNDRRLELRAEVEAAELAQREATGAAAHEVSDRKDEAAQRLLSDLGGAQEQCDVDEMAQWKPPCIGSRTGSTATARTAVSRFLRRVCWCYPQPVRDALHSGRNRMIDCRIVCFGT